MKIRLLLLCFILNCLSVPAAKAAFVIHPLSTNQTDSALTYSSTSAAPAYQDGWQHHHYGGPRREARKAWFWAMWGLFFWPFGILAIVHGFRALRRGGDGGLAVLAIIFGFAELLLCIWALFWIFYWGPVFVFVF